MHEYSITFARPARKDLERLHEPLCSRILERIEALAGVPRPAECRKLEGTENVWRIRVGDYRVVYSIEDQNRLIHIIAIGHRGDVYR